MWDDVAALLKNQFTVLRYDHRNHGQSLIESEPFSIDDMADDISSIISKVSTEPVHFVGLSLGGMVGQSLAARYPSLIRTLTVANSSSYYDDLAKKAWNDRIQAVDNSGVKSISKLVIDRWFTPEFLNSSDLAKNKTLEKIQLILESCDKLAYIQSCIAVLNVDTKDTNKKIAAPTLVLYGLKDIATPKTMSEQISVDIKNSILESIDAAHLSAVESPKVFVDKLMRFLVKY
jgi:3-oxoadipate enol-lactonase